jgi:uncharacterized protein YbaA (DUF1428 family)
MPYVDGFLLIVPKKKLAHYRRLAVTACKVWKKHGALEYRECVADDLSMKGPGSFVKRTKAKAGELIVFSWIVYRSKAHRNKVNAKVMKDPRIKAMMEVMKDKKKWPFDLNRMSMAGFKVLVED